MSEPLSFRELMRRVRAGDEEAAAELVRQYEGEIRRVIRVRLSGRLHRVIDSMDIAQSVFGNFFVRVAAGQFELDEPNQLVRLLVTMARNKLLDHARKPGNRPARASTGTLEQATGREDSPSQIVAHRELLQKVRDQLSDEERDLAEQRARGREWADIAADRDATPEALRKKLSRAIDRVAQQLGLEPIESE